MNETGFEFPDWAMAPNENLVREFEEPFDLSLPEDYWEFLAKHAGNLWSGLPVP